MGPEILVKTQKMLKGRMATALGSMVINNFIMQISIVERLLKTRPNRHFS
jgi:hypothetical protein